jgi:dethiobiotin synthetase
MKGVFITGIDTDVGKTVASVVVTKALSANYWKPIQCGDLSNSDSLFVKRNLPPKYHTIFPEAYALKHAVSPNKAAKMESVTIQTSEITLPDSDRTLVVEGAGGVLVPLNDKETICTLMQQLALPVILVVKNYLGSINHTLLSIEVLKQKGLTIAGIIIIGDKNEASEQSYEQQSGVRILGHIDWVQNFTASFFAEQANKLKDSLKHALTL